MTVIALILTALAAGICVSLYWRRKFALERERLHRGYEDAADDRRALHLAALTCAGCGTRYHALRKEALENAKKFRAPFDRRRR